MGVKKYRITLSWCAQWPPEGGKVQTVYQQKYLGQVSIFICLVFQST